MRDIVISGVKNFIHPIGCPCCQEDHGQRDYIESALEDLDEELTEKITPKGAGRSISRQPTVSVNETRVDESIEFFEELMEDYAGLLKASTVGHKPDENEDALYNDNEDSEWEWYYEEYRYYHTVTEQEIVEEDKDELSLVFLDLLIAVMLERAASLLLEEITIQRWVYDTREHIQQSTIANNLFGIGGKNTIDANDIRILEELINAQFTYFQKFAEEIRAGELTGAKILQRVGMYAEAITNGYEQAKARSHNITLPEYPGDGNQICLVNCRCRWVLKDDPKNTDYVLATWTLNPLAEHCESCVDNAKKWKPLRVKKGG